MARISWLNGCIPITRKWPALSVMNTNNSSLRINVFVVFTLSQQQLSRFLIPVLQPPLVQAIFNRNAEEVQLLLHKKEDVNALVSMRCMKLRCRTGSCHERFFFCMLNMKIQPLLIDLVFVPQDQERRTPLHAAACVGDVHIMDLLIESGEWAGCISDAWIWVKNLGYGFWMWCLL